tara:strand:- start:24811 stop:25350 length:540 start_codon:yes stop_codon:yes gene_type:complete
MNKGIHEQPEQEANPIDIKNINSNQTILDNKEKSKKSLTSTSDNGNEPQKTDDDIIEKPKKPEELPFRDFINIHLIPNLRKSLEKFNYTDIEIILQEGQRPVVGGNCWYVFVKLTETKRFWICFSSDSITSTKTFSLSESTEPPTLLESFLIDEKKTTLVLLVSRTLQRLNGQKWLGAN